jgi:lysophospholipase L1-like esterase
MTRTSRTRRTAARTAALTATALVSVAGLASGVLAPTASADSTTTVPTYHNYVALGDSYASGAGTEPVVDAKCDRSEMSYPYAVQTWLKPTTFKDVTCAGATTAQMTQAQGSVNAPQFNALSADTDLVTLTLGGNDIGFTDIITTCVVDGLSNPTGSPCKADFNKSGTDEITTRINAAASKLATTLKGIHTRAPKARVMVIGYPSIVPDSGKSCRPFADGDVPYLRDVNKELNSAIEAQAKSNGAEYVDTYTFTIGHDMCAADDGNRWIEPLNTTKGLPAHPNWTGVWAMELSLYPKLMGQS